MISYNVINFRWNVATSDKFLEKYPEQSCFTPLLPSPSSSNEPLLLPSLSPPSAIHKNASCARLNCAVTNFQMKEQMIPSEAVVAVLDKNAGDQRSFLLKMVHIVAVGLSLLVIWLAQPGSSKFV